MTYIRFGGKQILLECGLYQDSSYLESYKINSKKFPFNPEEIDYVFLGHEHIDHIGLLPKLVNEGFKGIIITTKESVAIIKHLLLNCAFILLEESNILSKRYNRDYKPIYTEEDVCRTLPLIKAYDEYHTIYQLDNIVSFQWLKNSHCVGAAQLQLILNNGLKTKKILYTSDIGALHSQNHYVYDTEIPSMFNDITIMESTYGLKSRMTKKTRKFDVEHLRVAVNTVLDRYGTLVLPAFSFSRTQELLTVLYLLFGNIPDFNTEIIVDSMLSCDICDDYCTILTDDHANLWRQVYNWKNVKFVREKADSQLCIADHTPKICISSSGFCTNGRILHYLNKYLRDENSMIIFSGYTGNSDSYLSYRIKNGKTHKTININKQPVPNRADCMCMSTFSSHANFDDLVTYGSSLHTNKLILCHGNTEAKNCLKEALINQISKNDKSYKVICSEKGMIINL